MAALHAAALPPGWNAASIAGLLDTPGTGALVDAAHRGFVMFRTAADEVEILTIVVDEAARRHGAGRTLLDAALAAARQGGARTAYLEVSSRNPAAQAFYAQAGFAGTGRRARYYPDGADAILLSLALV